MSKPFNWDERDIGVFRRVCTTMYIITVFALMGIQLYRQFVLHQPNEQWNDIAILLTFNVLVGLGAFMYASGRIDTKRIRVHYVLAGYVVFVLIGLAFTIFKYTVLLGQELGMAQVWDYLFMVAKISGILAVALGLVGYLGGRRIERQIE